MRANWSLCKKKNFFGVVKGFRVELVAFIYFTALGIFHLISQVGTYRVICYHVIGDNPDFDCSTGGHAHGGGGHHHSRHGSDQNALINETVQWTDNGYHLINSSAHGHGGHGGHGGGGHRGGNRTRWNHENQILNWTHENASSLVLGDTPAGESTSEHDRLEIELQKATVTWQMIFQLSHSLPALFADAMLGALGDRHGRQVNILIGLTGMMVSIYPMIIIFAIDKAPLFIIIIGNLLAGLTGSMSLVMISAFAYLADTVVDPQMLTVRMTYFSVIMSVARIFAPLLSNALLSSFSNNYAHVGLVSEAMLALSFFVCLFIVKQRPPMLMRKIMLDKYVKEHGRPPPAGNEKFQKYRANLEQTAEKSKLWQKPADPKPTGAESNRGCCADLVSVFKSIGQLWKEIYFTYTRKRLGNARMYLLFASFVYFLNSAFEGGVRGGVFSLYVQKSPFYWGPSEIATYQSINGALHLAGSMIGVVVLKKFLQLSDTTVILIAMGTHAIECLLFGFAKTTATLYLAAASGCLAMMINPCIKSFISQLVGADEVGKSFTAFGIATNVAHIWSHLMYSSIYRATVGWFAGFAFFLAGGLGLICMCLFFWLHLDYHYDGSILTCVKSGFQICSKRKHAEASSKQSTVEMMKAEAARAVTDDDL